MRVAAPLHRPCEPVVGTKTSLTFLKPRGFGWAGRECHAVAQAAHRSRRPFPSGSPLRSLLDAPVRFARSMRPFDLARSIHPFDGPVRCARSIRPFGSTERACWLNRPFPLEEQSALSALYDSRCLLTPTCDCVGGRTNSYRCTTGASLLVWCCPDFTARPLL